MSQWMEGWLAGWMDGWKGGGVSPHLYWAPTTCQVLDIPATQLSRYYVSHLFDDKTDT